MATVIPVRFAYAARDLWFDPGQTGALEGDHVICSTERGTEIGLATSDPFEVGQAELGRKTSNAALKPVLRVATDDDLDRAEELALKGDAAMPVFRRMVSESGLDMKPVGVEYLFGRERVVCYFAADERVDFRALVRSLSHELHERIDMRQIGVREEAAVVGGFGHCGQELCCARFGLSFEPVSIRMAKEQDLPLTSNKISGACGRLMCCLRYEFEAYRDFKSRAPKRNAVIDTPLGKAKIIEYDTPKEQLALRIENGKTVRIPLAEMVASEAAVKKSEELHCPCRPDTVLRASLDKLTSPDVQMALAELDRKNGVIKDDDFAEDDLFVEAKPRKRRSRRAGEQAPVQTPAPSASTEEEPASPSRRRRRRRSAKSGAEAPEQQPSQQKNQQAGQQNGQQGGQQNGQQGGQQGGQQSNQPAPQEEKRRRRRRRRSGSGAAAGAGAGEATAAASNANAPARAAPTPAQEQGKEGEGKTRRRRRHRTSSASANGNEGNAQTQAQAQAQQPKSGDQSKSDDQPKPRRRPGDRGGQGGKQGQAPQQQQQQSADGAPAPRRRRRRGGRGRGGNGGGGGNGGTASAPTE